MTEPADKASFGYRDVPASEKAGLVARVFDSVAPRYDLMNDLMSAGVHRLWKNALVDVLAPRKGEKFLDVAGGTGDIAFRIVKRLGGEADVTICDINPAMLEVGRDRLGQAGLAARAGFAIGNAEALPFADQRFDAFTIAFGIRNVTRIDKALAEARRVLKRGGRFLCLEFSCCDVPVLDRLYDFHSFEVIPRLGALAAGAAEPYRYLVESIRAFPDQRRFAGMIGKAGFQRVSFRNLTGGIAAIHSGWRL